MANENQERRTTVMVRFPELPVEVSIPEDMEEDKVAAYVLAVADEIARDMFRDGDAEHMLFEGEKEPEYILELGRLSTDHLCRQQKAEIQEFAAEWAATKGFRREMRIEDFVKDQLGGEIAYVGFMDIVDEWGSLIVSSPSDFKITLLNFSSPRTDRVSVAHELGHYVLHFKEGAIVGEAERGGTTPLEWEANWFAAGFLMPEAEFKTQHGKCQGNTYMLANYFGVPTDFVKIRGAGLELDMN